MAIAPNPSKPRLLVIRKIPDAVEKRLLMRYDADLNRDDRIYEHDEIIARARGHDALIVTVADRISRELIERLPDSIRIIASYSVGYDHIDLAAAAARGMIVTNTPDVLTDATAEIAFLLMLGAARGAHDGERMVRDGSWSSWSLTEMLGTQLTGKRLGILGMGRIGQAVASRARAFGMRIHYHNRKPIAPELEGDATYHSTADALFAVSDFLSIHCASTPETRKMVNRARLALMPRGAILVNTARGDIVVDDALIEAMQSGHISAAGLDVFNNEPLIDPRYRNLANSFLLPHLGSATVETRDAMGFRALDNLDAFFDGKTPPDLVRR